MINRSD